MKRYRIAIKLNNIGNLIYLPQIKILFLWVRLPIQRPTDIDHGNSPWNSNKDWAIKQIKTHKLRSKLDKKIIYEYV